MEKTSAFGDPALSSSQLRKKAYEVISKSSRPLAACEIESWIRANDAVLWKKVSSKCKDYIRIILSQTRGDKISKFKCVKPPSDVDKRANFFGITGRTYDSNDWILVDDDKNKNSKKQNRKAAFEETSTTQNASNETTNDLGSPASPANEVVQPQKKRVVLPPLPEWVSDVNKWCYQNFTFLGNTILPTLSLVNYQ